MTHDEWTARMDDLEARAKRASDDGDDRRWELIESELGKLIMHDPQPSPRQATWYGFLLLAVVCAGFFGLGVWLG